MAQSDSSPKSKLMDLNAGDETTKLNREDFENIEEFTHFESQVSTDGNVFREVRTRIAKAAVAVNF